eukprot:GHVQ01010520.1.p1 GENE.GHVQ01010520.1~~GHVQ01010520.1.p1  ORF type:complete len:338 (-),score=82.34 GHVQ01010520.1:35-1024(-)
MLSSSACERNRDPILRVLKPLLLRHYPPTSPPTSHLPTHSKQTTKQTSQDTGGDRIVNPLFVEVAGGTGQHMEHFVTHMGGWSYLPTDVCHEHLRSIEAYRLQSAAVGGVSRGGVGGRGKAGEGGCKVLLGGCAGVGGTERNVDEGSGGSVSVYPGVYFDVSRWWCEGGNRELMQFMRGYYGIEQSCEEHVTCHQHSADTSSNSSTTSSSTSGSSSGSSEQLGRVDMIYCANMIHISSDRAVTGLFNNAGVMLKGEGRGVLVTYGPYAFDGAVEADSNRRFDASLRRQNEEWGLRDVGELDKLGVDNGLVLQQVVQMPANNHVLVFVKS